jgi:hypothetical protein
MSFSQNESFQEMLRDVSAKLCNHSNMRFTRRDPEIPEPIIHCVIDAGVTGQLLNWGMTLEEYEPIQEIGERPIYYGPKPPAYGQTSWGFPEQHILFYESEGIESVDYKKRGITFEEFKAEQKILQRWYNITKEMREIQYKLDDVWYKKREPHRRHFLRIMDGLSTWGCYECEVLYRLENGRMKYHGCCDCDLCEGCGSKFCSGCAACYDDDDRY